ncbi:MAG: hypothetical protein HC945_00140 [Nitrosarchaeum sp.]|nr:hypothetical protein [Nitrosarchaeum sp.]
MCNKESALFEVVGRESVGPRAAASALLAGKEGSALYRYLLDGSVKLSCPAEVDLDEFVIRARQNLVKSGQETAANQRMIAKVRLYGTPFPPEE